MLAVAVLAQLGIFRSEVSIYQGRDSAYINGTVTVNFRKINGTCNTNDTVPVNGTSELADYFTLYDWKTLHNKTDWPQVLCLNSSSVLFSPASLYGIPQDEEEKPKIPEKNTTIVINGTLYNMTYGPDRDPAPPRPVRLLRLPRGETNLVPTFEEDDLELDSKPVARDFIPRSQSSRKRRCISMNLRRRSRRSQRYQRSQSLRTSHPSQRRQTNQTHQISRKRPRSWKRRHHQLPPRAQARHSPRPVTRLGRRRRRIKRRLTRAKLTRTRLTRMRTRTRRTRMMRRTQLTPKLPNSPSCPHTGPGLHSPSSI
uniref:Uncharacterized protein n=1 Tax=Bionectria ochroleuca TaxID=29856 RepID=A0A8H7K1E6_BIOOC